MCGPSSVRDLKIRWALQAFIGWGCSSESLPAFLSVTSALTLIFVYSFFPPVLQKLHP